MPTICNFAVLSSRLLVSTRLAHTFYRSVRLNLTPVNHIFFEVYLQYYLKMAILDRFQKSDLEKWAEERCRIRTWADTLPNLFLIYYTVEYQ